MTAHQARPGFTLIEVVAAAALLTLIIASCLPLFAGARRDLQASSAVALGEPTGELSEAVDELLRQMPGLARELLDQPEGFGLRWTVREREYRATARVVARAGTSADDRSSGHVWAVFHVDRAEIPRWLRIIEPRSREEGAP